jgi:hypothetical protein
LLDRVGSVLLGDDDGRQEVEVDVKSQPRCVPQCPHDAILQAYPGNQESFSVGCSYHSIAVMSFRYLIVLFP